MELDIRHWRMEAFSQKVTREEWQDYLLMNEDTITCSGHLRKLKAKKIFGDVYAISKTPLAEWRRRPIVMKEEE